MKRLKYLIDKSGNFAIFTDVQSHEDMARGMYQKPVGAGFCDIAVGYYQEDGKEKQNVSVHCYGESASLGIKANQHFLMDEFEINKIINNAE